MGAVQSARMWFSNIISGGMKTTDRISAGKAITTDQVSFLMGMSDFATLDEYEIYEQLYAFEAEIGGAIDRMSTMAGDSMKSFCLRNVGKASVDPVTLELIPSSTTAIAEEMVDQANMMMDDLELREHAGALVEILLIHGMILTTNTDGDYSITILPNKTATLLGDLSYKGGGGDANLVITDPKYLVLNEGTDQEVVYGPGNFQVTKYKLTPVWAVDQKGRSTFGIFSVSPMHRCVLPVWESRQLRIIDLLWRFKMVPREHHKFISDQFALGNYTGSMDKRREAARKDAKKMMDDYTTQLKQMAPDVGYVTLDTTEIDIVENKSGGYMKSNERMDQLVEQFYIALTTPRAVVNGESPGSYAAMTVVSNYVALKVTSLTRKIKPLILANVRKRLLAINPNYPVALLDLRVSLILANNKLDLFRQAAIMGQLGLFTRTEIREMLEYLELREDQLSELVKTGNSATPADAAKPAPGVEGTQGGETPSNNLPKYPETPASNAQHATLPGTKKAIA